MDPSGGFGDSYEGNTMGICHSCSWMYQPVVRMFKFSARFRSTSHGMVRWWCGNRLKKPSKTKPVPKKLDQTAVPSSERGHGNVWYDKMDKQHSRGNIADCMILICLIECGYQKILGHLFACGVDVSFRAGPLFAEEAWPASADVALVQES